MPHFPDAAAGFLEAEAEDGVLARGRADGGGQSVAGGSAGGDRTRRHLTCGMGGAVRPPPRGGGRPRGLAVRVLRAGVDRGLAGPRVLAGTAAGPSRGPGQRSRAGRGQVLRCGAEPVGDVGAPPAGRRDHCGAGRPGPGMGRAGGRGIRAGVLRQPVRDGRAAAAALRRPAVDAGGGREGRFRLRA